MSDRSITAADFLASRSALGAQKAIVLGSGLNDFVNQLEILEEYSFADIPGFPQATVKGHVGKLSLARYKNQRLWLMQGRFHFYEGYSMEEVVLPQRVFHRLGVTTLILTNASGSLNPAYRVGDMVCISDHINLIGSNPLMGPNRDDLGPRFPDMSAVYDSSLRQCVLSTARREDIRCHEGVYVALSGPCYETPAEYRFLRIIGGDCVGMSTVPEAIAARHMGMRLAAISVITDLGVSDLPQRISHEEVLIAAKEASGRLAVLLTSLLQFD